MVGFTLSDVPVRIMTDYVDDALTDFARTIVDTYTDLERRDRYCGYACRYRRRRLDGAAAGAADELMVLFSPRRLVFRSDHASYNRSGFPSSAVFEAVPNPRCVVGSSRRR